MHFQCIPMWHRIQYIFLNIFLCVYVFKFIVFCSWRCCQPKVAFMYNTLWNDYNKKFIYEKVWCGNRLIQITFVAFLLYILYTKTPGILWAASSLSSMIIVVCVQNACYTHTDSHSKISTSFTDMPRIILKTIYRNWKKKKKLN